jgi:hypothetical protein
MNTRIANSAIITIQVVSWMPERRDDSDSLTTRERTCAIFTSDGLTGSYLGPEVGLEEICPTLPTLRTPNYEISPKPVSG